MHFSRRGVDQTYPRRGVREWRGGILLGFCLSIMLSVSASSAAADPIACGQGEKHCRLSGGFSAVSVADPAADAVGITHPSTPMSGALIYADFVQVEQRARALLDKGLKMRESISPYKDNNNFDNFLRKLNVEAGWEDAPLPEDAAFPEYATATSFTDLVDQIEQDLTEARDLYAFLTVFGPEGRFRADGVYNASLCGATDKEDLNPKSNPEEPTVLPPVIDWCNFRARLRQSVREVANVRMIVGQEFMVDALGVNFSGGFLGGEDFVKEEVAQLRAARYQFEKAEEYLASGLKKAVGNGCLISDFYTQSEWSLLSRAAERQGDTQYHIATRQSYLNVGDEQGLPQAQATAQQTLRQTANDTHIKLIGLAALGVPVKQNCQIGERPDGDAVAEMALRQLETKRQSQGMAAGLNIFGFDVTMTPARAYLSSTPKNCDTQSVGDRGLWDEAWCLAQEAEKKQVREENKTRFFDASQEKLIEGLNGIVRDLDIAIDDTSGCLRIDFANDAAFFACAKGQAKEARTCWTLAAIDKKVDARTLDPPSDYANFEACIESGNFNRQNDFDTALNAMRSDYLAWQEVVKRATNINKQIQNSNDANATVTKWLGIAGGAETAARVAQATFDAIASANDIGEILGGGAASAAAGTINATLQGTAGALSTAADVKIANAENEKEIGNLLLQMSELLIEAEAAKQAYRSTWSDVGGLIGYFNRTVGEAKRQRAYFAVSPANDPSFRIVRDSARLELADVLERAARISYLAARRAEYEYAARLPANDGFRISDIYRARTAQDIEAYLNQLASVTGGLAGSSANAITPIDLQISIAHDVLQLTDDLLRSEGFTTPDAIEAERTRRFRLWVAQNTVLNRFDAQADGKPALRFSFSTSLLNGGLFSNVISQGYGNQWLLKLTQAGEIVPGRAEETNGVSVNLVSDETDLSHRKVVMTQGGVAHMSSFGGCIFDYRLIAPAKLLGNDWPESQPAESAVASFTASVNSPGAANKLFQIVKENGYRASDFAGRAISASDWEIIVFAGTPQANLGLPDMDLQKLTDIQLNLSATYVSRADSYNGPPAPAECTRIDY